MMIETQSQRSASPTGAALNNSGGEMMMSNATEYQNWAQGEKRLLDEAGKTSGLRYEAIQRHVAAAQIIAQHPELSNAPRLPRETDIRDWAARVLPPSQVARYR